MKHTRQEHKCASIFRPVAGVPHRRRAWSPLKSAFVSERGRHRQLGDRRWQICLTTNVHLSPYWKALSQWWFMFKVPHTLPLPSPPALRSNTFPYSPCRTGRKCGPVISPVHAVQFARRTLGLSLGRTWEDHLFPFTLLSPSQRKIFTIHLWMTLFTSVQSSCFNTAGANGRCHTTKITYFQRSIWTAQTDLLFLSAGLFVFDTLPSPFSSPLSLSLDLPQ